MTFPQSMNSHPNFKQVQVHSTLTSLNSYSLYSLTQTESSSLQMLWRDHLQDNLLHLRGWNLSFLPESHDFILHLTEVKLHPLALSEEQAFVLFEFGLLLLDFLYLLSLPLPGVGVLEHSHSLALAHYQESDQTGLTTE